MLKLRHYQAEAVQAVYDHLQSRNDNPCVVLPTGSGKSLCLAQICSDAVLRWGGRVLILAHVTELLQQNADKLHRLAPDVEFGVYSAGLNSRNTQEPVIIAGIQSVYQKACELGAFDLVLIDEAHLLPESGEGMYRTFLKEAKIVNPNVRLIGFTATPYRLSSGMICKPRSERSETAGTDTLLNHICYEKGIKELINEGYLCRIHTKVPAQKIDCSKIHVRNGEFRADEVAELFSTETVVHSIFTDIFRKTHDRNKILVFCADVAQATLFQREIQRVADVGLITGETPSHERAELIARFQDKPTGLLNESKPLRWLVNVNVLTTGFDAPNIDCVVLARPTLSPGLYYQMCLDMETEILTPSGWRRCHEIAKGDMVGIFDIETEEIVYVAAEDKVHRALRREESMYGILSPRLDIRVTNNHNMLVRCKGVTNKRWQLQTAEQVASRKESYQVPIAGRGERFASEADLSDAEVAFLGWFLTDGYRNPYNGTIAISQSVIKFHDEIRRVLTECNFGFREYRQKRQGNLANYEDTLLFVIPYGKPRGEQYGKNGWAYLEEWIDKDMPSLYDTLSKRQFHILVDAMNKANGRHCKTLDYVPRTKTIYCGCRRRLADRIQQLAIERGFRCDVRSFCFNPSKWNRTPQIQWCVAIREKQTAFVGGTRKDNNALGIRRSQFGAVSFTSNEWVWCLTTEKGTLVTRRNGKVAMLGNCGRGFRLAPGKADCLVLDYGGNIGRHGCVDAIRIKTKSGGILGGEAPIRECPECHNVLPISLSRCAECGYVFPMPEPESKLDATASKDGILSGQIKETEYEVLHVAYSKHYKKNGTPDDPPTLRVDYEVAVNTFVQKWVCPEHKGWAWSNKFVPWWMKRTDIKPPTTVDEALHYSHYLAVPQRITVVETAGQRFAEILEHDFTERPDPPESYTPPHTCGDCGLFYRGDCPYKTGLWGEEPACEHFLDPQNIEPASDDVPF